MFSIAGFFQVRQFFDDLVGVLGAELIDVTRTMVAEGAFAPVAPTRTKVGDDTLG